MNETFHRHSCEGIRNETAWAAIDIMNFAKRFRHKNADEMTAMSLYMIFDNLEQFSYLLSLCVTHK